MGKGYRSSRWVLEAGSDSDDEALRSLIRDPKLGRSAVEFELAPVLAVVTGIWLDEPERVTEVLSFMMGEMVTIGDLPVALRMCAPALSIQHPGLATVDARGIDAGNADAWLEEQTARFGSTVLVRRLSTAPKPLH